MGLAGMTAGWCTGGGGEGFPGKNRGGGGGGLLAALATARIGIEVREDGSDDLSGGHVTDERGGVRTRVPRVAEEGGPLERGEESVVPMSGRGAQEPAGCGDGVSEQGTKNRGSPLLDEVGTVSGEVIRTVEGADGRLARPRWWW